VLPFSITVALQVRGIQILASRFLALNHCFLQSVTIFVVCARLFTRIFITQKAGADDCAPTILHFATTTNLGGFF